MADFVEGCPVVAVEMLVLLALLVAPVAVAVVMSQSSVAEKMEPGYRMTDFDPQIHQTVVVR